MTYTFDHKIHRMLFKSVLLIGAAALFSSVATAQNITLKASHQWPGGRGDVRDEMVQIIAKEMAKANVGVTIKVYPGKSLPQTHAPSPRSNTTGRGL